MKRSTKYVALDVHQAMTVASVREDSGRVIARTVLETHGPSIVAYLRGMRGAVHVAFEEGTQSQWLDDPVAPIADRVVVCDGRRLDHPGNKGDQVDADRLSELLRLGGSTRCITGARTGPICESSLENGASQASIGASYPTRDPARDDYRVAV